jgi:hypothetical protein
MPSCNDLAGKIALQKEIRQASNAVARLLSQQVKAGRKNTQ